MKDRQVKATVILGPTSSGKSAVAIKLAKKFNGEVISADSRQVYRDMNLGTGKVEGQWVSASELSSGYPELSSDTFISENIPHHLIDFRSPRGEYNISHFQKDCLRKIQEISARGRLPIICGGTGFWISAIVDGIIFPQVRPDKKLRRQLDNKTTRQLFYQLKKLDPVRAKTIDENNKIRLIRAIEICKSLGKVPELINTPPQSPLALRGEEKHPNYQLPATSYQLIGIDHSQEVLDQKIKKRLESRWTDGMIKEVKSLKKKYGLSWKKIQSFGLAYYWIPLYLQNKLSLEELKEKVFIAERGYAKRQRTWFKRDGRIIWENSFKKICEKVNIFLDK